MKRGSTAPRPRLSPAELLARGEAINAELLAAAAEARARLDALEREQADEGN